MRGCPDEVDTPARSVLCSKALVSVAPLAASLHLSCTAAGETVSSELAFVIPRDIQEFGYLQKSADNYLHLVNKMASKFRLGRNWN